MFYNLDEEGLKKFEKDINQKIQFADRTYLSLYVNHISVSIPLTKEDKVKLTYDMEEEQYFIDFDFKSCYLGSFLYLEDILKIEYKNECSPEYILNYHKIYLKDNSISFKYYFDEEEELLNKKIYGSDEEY